MFIYTFVCFKGALESNFEELELLQTLMSNLISAVTIVRTLPNRRTFRCFRREERCNEVSPASMAVLCRSTVTTVSSFLSRYCIFLTGYTAVFFILRKF